ncbi:MAG: hypothetical protein ACC726_10460 [Chloroflexota bacterium]
MRKRYEVTATREGEWWVLRFPALGGASQARRLDQAEAVARDYIYGMTDEPEESFDVDIQPNLDKPLAEMLAVAVASRGAAQKAQVQASRAQRQAVIKLSRAGLTDRDAGLLLGLTHQRVAQLRADQKLRADSK